MIFIVETKWSQAMTPQIPGYLVVFESAIRPIMAAIALGLIWIGAFRMKGPAPSRYMTAGRPVRRRGKYVFRDH
jgi:hypothetical protein